jgi:hypothetical protein
MTPPRWPTVEGTGSELSEKLKRRMDLVLEETFRDELPMAEIMKPGSSLPRGF